MADIAPDAENACPQSVVFSIADIDGGLLREALAGQRWACFDHGLRNECFILGARCAKAGGAIPDWLSTAPLWAEAAALEGFRAWAARLDISTDLPT
jgi:hypothetical protein